MTDVLKLASVRNSWVSISIVAVLLQDRAIGVYENIEIITIELMLLVTHPECGQNKHKITDLIFLFSLVSILQDFHSQSY